MPRYFAIHKPYGVLSQFTREAPHHRTLADLGFDFPRTVYPVGRLDRDSEGLLLITDDKRLTDRLLNPKYGHRRTYAVRVEGARSQDAEGRLRSGVDIRIKQRVYRTLPIEVKPLAPTHIAGPLPRNDEYAPFPPRDPPVRFRKSVPDHWLELTLTEGKNRQVRRMCAAVGLPVLRLIRTAIEDLTLADLAGQTVKEIDVNTLYARLKLKS